MKFKRFLSLFLAICIIATLLPPVTVPATAASSANTVTDTNVHAADGWSWRLEDFTLIISGSGPMENYNSSSSLPPWPKNITAAIIEPGITSIGDYAFYDCYYLSSVTIPDTVTDIGNYTFYGCEFLSSITIPDSVTNIGDSAFAFCSQMTTVTLGNSLTTISSYAFDNCTKLSDITIPDSVTSIGGYAFANCDSLTGIIIPSQVVTIGKSAFQRCDGLTSVIIAEGVSSIGESAFYYCSKLTTVSIPNSVTYIGDYAFSDCSKLTYNTYGTGKYLGNTSNPYLALNGISSFAQSIDIHGDTRFVLSYAFNRCSLTSITVPGTVISIAKAAFFGCSKLESLTIPFVGRSAETEPDGFIYPFGNIFGTLSTGGGTATKQRYSSITTPDLYETYYIPANLKTVTVTGGRVPYGAFSNCTGLTGITIGENVTGIDSYAFENCTGLTEITVPGNIPTIGNYAFSGCTGLTDVTLDTGVTGIGDYAFFGCTSLNSISIPDGITTIGNDAFSGCEDVYNWSLDRCKYLGNSSNRYLILMDFQPAVYVTKATVNQNTKIIQYGAFADCSSLTSITLPEGLITIGDYAFKGCSGLTEITIPSSVTAIGDYAFKNCTGLTSIDIPDNVTTIGDYAFQNCSKATDISIGSCVTHIGDYAFSNCPGETDFILPDTLVSLGAHAFEYCNGIKSISIPTSVTTIGSGAFYYCKNLTQIVIPDNVTYLGSGAFYGCTALQSVQLSRNITGLESTTFYNCTALTAMDIPDSVTFIGDSAFSGCSALTRVSTGDGVTTIGEYAFNGCSKLAEIVLGKNISTINSYAFNECYAITGVTIPSDLNISNLCFSISNLPTTVYDNGKYLGNAENPYMILLDAVSDDITACTVHKDTKIIHYGAFSGCSKLTTVTIPDGVVTIGESAFSSCSALKTITIPNSVTSIGSYAFWGCNSLVSITLPFIGPSAKTSSDTYQYPLGYIFAANSASNGTATKQQYYGSSTTSTTSTTYYIPSSLKSVTVTGGNITYGAFYNCTGLTDITIGNGVKSISPYAFFGCSKLTNISIGAGATNISTTAFSSTSALERIEVDPNNPSYISLSGCLYYKDGKQIIHRPAALKLYLTVNFVDSHGNSIYESIVARPSYGATYSYAVPDILGFYTETTSITGTIAEDTVLTVVYYEKTITANGTCGDNIRWTLYDDGMLVIKGTGVIPEYTSGSAPWYAYRADIKEAYIDSRITRIGSYSFENCSSLTYIDFGYGMTQIGLYAFTGCTSLKSMLFPDTVTAIEDCAFSGCTGLTSIVLSDSVTAVGSNAFLDCTSLKKATLGAAVESIGDNAFSGCTQLAEVYFRGAPAAMGTESLGSTYGKYVYYYTNVSGWNEAIEDGLWYGYTAIPYNAIAKENFTGSNIYILKVVDKHNTPLANAVVDMGGNIQTTNEDGMAYFVLPDAPIALSVSCSNHITFTDPAYAVQNTRSIDIIELSDRPSAVQGVSCDGKSIATSVYTLNCNTEDTVNISVNGYSKYDILRYELMQGSRLIATEVTSANNITFSVAANSFEEGDAVIVKMYTADGSSVSAGLNIEVLRLADISQMQILDELSQLQLHFNVGSLGSFDLPLSFKSSNGQEIYTCTDGKTIRVGINMDVGKFFDGSVNEATAKSRIQNAIQEKIRNFAETDAGFQYNLAGYIEIEYLGNGQYYVKTSYVKISVGAGIEFNAQASYFGIVGVYFKVGLSGTGSLELTVSRFSPEEGFTLDDVTLGIENALEMEGGAYLLWGAGSASVYGNLNMGFQLGIVPEVEFESVYINGELGVKWSVFWGAFSGTKRIAGGDIYTWPDASTYSLRTLLAQSIADAQNDPSLYTYNDRAYLTDRSQWLSGISLLGDTDGSYSDLQMNTYYNVAPKVVTCGSTTVMVWLDDNEDRDSSNYQTLYYSVYDAVSDTWSDPSQLDNNDTFDCEFDLVTDGTGIYVIYTEQKALMTGTDALDIEDPEDVAQLISGVEVAFAAFENGTFTEPVRLTENSSCETLPRLTASDGQLVAAWNTADGMNFASQSEQGAVCTAIYKNGAWATPTAWAEDQNRICDVATVYLDGQMYCAYVVDCDNQAESSTNQILILCDSSGNARQLAQGSISKVSAEAVCGAAALLWSNNGSIYMLADIAAGPVAMLPENAAASGSYQAVTLADGQTILTYSAMSESNGSDIYAVRVNAAGCTGAPVRLTNTQGYIDNYSVSALNGELLITFTETVASITEDAVQTQTHLRYTNYSFRTDIAVEQAQFDISQAAPSALLDVSLSLRNTGFTDVSGITVNLYDAQQDLLLSDDYVISIPHGQSVSTQVQLILPDTISPESYTLEVLPYGAEDTQTANNRTDLTLGYSDFSVYAEQKIIGSRSYLVLVAENAGNITAYANIDLYMPDTNGSLVAQVTTDDIAPGQKAQYLVDIGSFTDAEQKLITCLITSAQYDPFTLNNTCALSLYFADTDGFLQDPDKTTGNPILSPAAIAYDKYTQDSVQLSITAEADHFSGITGLISGTDYILSGSELTLTKSYLDALAVGVHTLEISFLYDDADTVTRTLTIGVSDSTPIQLSGTVGILGDALVDTAVYADVSGLTPLTDSLSYLWTVDGIVVGTDITYTPVLDDFQKVLTLTVTGSGGYIGSFAASQTVELRKPNAPLTPVVTQVTNNSVRLVKTDGVEYSTDGVSWQDSAVFTDLVPNTVYSIYARYPASESTYASDPSAAATVTTLKNSIGAPEAPTVEAVTDVSVTLTAVAGNLYSMDGINWQESSTFTGLEANTTYSFYQKTAETDTTYESPVSMAVSATTKKHTAEAPAAPTIVKRSHNTVTLAYVEGCEYSMDGIHWQNEDSGLWHGPYSFTGLSPNTEYTFYQRVMETDTSYASPVSEPLVARTWKQTVTGPSAPVLEAVTQDSITVAADPSYEYKIEPYTGVIITKHPVSNGIWGTEEEPQQDNVGWQSSNVFTGLLPNTSYQIYQRYAATDISYASYESAYLVVTTSKATAQTPSAPILKEQGTTFISVEEIAGYEYMLEGGSWQASGTFTDLTPGKTYSIYCRTAETDTAFASSASEALTVQTLKITTDVPSAPVVESVTWDTIVLVHSEGYLYKLNDGPWQSSNIFTGLLPNNSYTAYRKLAETDTAKESLPSEGTEVVTQKQTVSAPDIPTLESKTYDTITLTPNEAYEYMLQGGQWQTSNVFTGLAPSTAYVFYQRVRETDTAYASAASTSAVYITEALIVIDGEITITGKPQYGEQLAVELSGFIGDTSQISCQWYADGTLIEGATELIYTVTQEDMGKTLTVRLTGLGAYTGELECSSVILAYVPGDTDGDCLVTDQDAIALNRYLAGWQVQVDLQAADVDGDGAVSDWDAILLERYLAGWEIELLSPDTE